jgi:hypothetical protein
VIKVVYCKTKWYSDFNTNTKNTISVRIADSNTTEAHVNDQFFVEAAKEQQKRNKK